METQTTYSIKEIIRPHQTLVAKREKLKFRKLSSFLMKTFVAIYTSLYKKNIASKDPAFAIYYTIDFENRETDVAAAVPVEDGSEIPEEFERIFFPTSRAITTTYFGPYEDTLPAYAALDRYLQKEGLQKALVIEEYITDPRLEKDRSKWQTNLYYVLK
jgi:effector-binding domain-containing protein